LWGRSQVERVSPRGLRGQSSREGGDELCSLFVRGLCDGGEGVRPGSGREEVESGREPGRIVVVVWEGRSPRRNKRVVLFSPGRKEGVVLSFIAGLGQNIGLYPRTLPVRDHVRPKERRFRDLGLLWCNEVDVVELRTV